MKRTANLKSLACLFATLSFATAAHAQGSQTQSSEAKKATEAHEVRPAQAGQAADKKAEVAQHIEVQHILIGYAGSIPGKNIQRTPRAAQKLAAELVKSIKGGASFDSLVKKYTDDAYPGIYGMSNEGVPPAKGEFPRGGMVKGFGNTAFSLKVGEVGLCKFDSVISPYGYHIIKRLK